MTGRAGDSENGPPADHEALFSVSCADAERADRVRTAVAREIGEIDDDRSRATVETASDGTPTVRVSVDARDVSALRAATGTWLGLVETARRTAAVAERAGEGDE